MTIKKQLYKVHDKVHLGYSGMIAWVQHIVTQVESTATPGISMTFREGKPIKLPSPVVHDMYSSIMDQLTKQASKINLQQKDGMNTDNGDNIDTPWPVMPELPRIDADHKPDFYKSTRNFKNTCIQAPVPTERKVKKPVVNPKPSIKGWLGKKLPSPVAKSIPVSRKSRKFKKHERLKAKRSKAGKRKPTASHMATSTSTSAPHACCSCPTCTGTSPTAGPSALSYHNNDYDRNQSSGSGSQPPWGCAYLLQWEVINVPRSKYAHLL